MVHPQRGRGRRQGYQPAARGNPVVPWLGQGNVNDNPRARRPTAEERDRELINFLRSKGVLEAELRPAVFVVPHGRHEQGPVINGFNGQVCVRLTGMGRRRRLFLRSWLRHGDTTQAIGDRNALIEMLADDADAVNVLCQQIRREGGQPVKMPKIFENDPDVSYLQR